MYDEKYDDKKSRELFMRMFTDLRNNAQYQVDTATEKFNLELEGRWTWKNDGPCLQKDISVPLRKAKYFMLGLAYYAFINENYKWFGLIHKDCIRQFACVWEIVKDLNFLQDCESHSEIDFNVKTRVIANQCTVFKPEVIKVFSGGERFYRVPNRYCKFYEVSKILDNPDRFEDWIDRQGLVTKPDCFDYKQLL